MRRIVDDFAAALEGTGSVSTSAPQLAPLVNLAQQLQSLPLGPTPAFRDSLRQRLVAVAAVTEPLSAPPAPLERARHALDGWRIQRRLRTSAAVLASVVVLTGVATISSRSLPGDPLYRVKRAAESTQVQLARGDVNRGKRELQHAATRLDEVRELALARSALAPSARQVGAAQVGAAQVGAAQAGAAQAGPVLASAGDTDRIVSTLVDMDGATRRGVELLFDASRNSDSAEPLAVIADFAAGQQSGLAAVLSALPAAARDRATTSIDLLARIRMTSTVAMSRLANCPAAGCAPLDTAGCDCTPGDQGSPAGGAPGGSAPGQPGQPGGTAGPTPPAGPGGPTGNPAPVQPGGAPSDQPAPVVPEIGDLLDNLPPLPVPSGGSNLPLPLPTSLPLPPPTTLPVPPLPLPSVSLPPLLP